MTYFRLVCERLRVIEPAVLLPAYGPCSTMGPQVCRLKCPSAVLLVPLYDMLGGSDRTARASDWAESGLEYMCWKDVVTEAVAPCNEGPIEARPWA